jgi:NAD(P)-dependent dehydrogenase (short-subunit alcohol dehydrogenase family)
VTEKLRFDGRVAIITGAGGQAPSLGAAHAKLLASRGAKIVVNARGDGPAGGGELPADAQAVVDEIRAAGGEAIGDVHSCAEAESARAVVRTALDAWGRVDILINNAGVYFEAFFAELSEGDIGRIHGSSLFGHIWMTRAVWRHMREADYGRIVNVSSRAAFGIPQLSVYGAAKAGVIGLTNCLALECAGYDIKVNAVMPEAMTKKREIVKGDGSGAAGEKVSGREHEVDTVAQAVAYLCHEQCEPNGATFNVKGQDGTIVEYRPSLTVGYQNPQLTVEDVATNIDRVRDLDGTNLYSREFPAERFQAAWRRPYVPQ